jgi:hypothetical protein
VLKGFFDDSQTDPKVASPNWCVGGYIGDDHHWEHYQDFWPMALANHEIPYFHSKEFMRPKGIYSKWHPLHEHKAEINVFMADLIKVITQSYLRGFMCVVRIPDLDRFNAEHRLQLEPYPLAVYGCMLGISKEYFFEPMKLFFDAAEKVDSRLVRARAYADSDEHYREDNLGRMLLYPLTEFHGAKRVIELQAADLLAGDFRKNHLSVNEWYEIEGKPEDHEERHRHFEEWAERKYGTREPSLRKSLQAAVDGSRHVPWVWDYDRLCEAHTVRGGVWA